MFEDEDIGKSEVASGDDENETQANGVESLAKEDAGITEAIPHYEHHCMLCGTGYFTEMELESHIEKVHEIKCKECNEPFYDKFDLERHKVIHIRSVSVPATPVEHTAQDGTDEVTLGSGFDDDTDAVNRVFLAIAEVFGDEIKEEEVKIMSEADIQRIFTVIVKCGEVGIDDTPNNKSQPEIRDNSQTLNSGNNINEVELFFECESCTFKTKDANDLRKHREHNHQAKKCPDCNYTSNSEFAFNLHTQTDHI